MDVGGIALRNLHEDTSSIGGPSWRTILAAGRVDGFLVSVPIHQNQGAFVRARASHIDERPVTAEIGLCLQSRGHLHALPHTDRFSCGLQTVEIERQRPEHTSGPDSGASP